MGSSRQIGTVKGLAAKVNGVIGAKKRAVTMTITAGNWGRTTV
jgi:hypothetical protein